MKLNITLEQVMIFIMLMQVATLTVMIFVFTALRKLRKQSMGMGGENPLAALMAGAGASGAGGSMAEHMERFKKVGENNTKLMKLFKEDEFFKSYLSEGHTEENDTPLWDYEAIKKYVDNGFQQDDLHALKALVHAAKAKGDLPASHEIFTLLKERDAL